MPQRAASEPGYVRIRHKFIAWLVHGNVPVQSKTEQADVNGAVASQPAPDAFALTFRVARIALEAGKTMRGDAKRLQQLPLQIRVARGWIASWQAAPFINLQHAQLLEKCAGNI